MNLISNVNFDYGETTVQINEDANPISPDKTNSIRNLSKVKVTSSISANPKTLQQYIATLPKYKFFN